MSDVFSLMAKIGLDSKEYTQKLEKAGDDMKSFEKKSKGIGDSVKGLGSGIKGLAGTLGNIASVGVKAFGAISTAVSGASAGIGFLVKAAVDGYGEYEQLKGGIETLFGTSGKKLEEYAQSVNKSVDEVRDKYNQLQKAQTEMLNNANRAYKEAGMSANNYMNTAIGISGALIKSVGDDATKAATLVDTAVKDMSDMANKYGQDMQMYRDTYMSLARGNTQTLDNLFGGMFAGTKQGLRDMLDYAEKYRASLGETVSYSTDSYADIVSAIHDVSVAVGVYGTTHDEAAKTIQGSLSMLKGAWENLMSGFANPELNVDTLINDVVEAAEIALKNLMPVVERALVGIGTLFEKVAPIVAEKLPGILDQILPNLLSAATILITTLVANLPSILQAVAPSLIDAVGQVVSTLGEMGGNFLTYIQDFVNNIDWATLSQDVATGLQNLFTGIDSFLVSVGTYLSGYDWNSILSVVWTVLTTIFTSGAEVTANIGSSIITAISNGITEYAPGLLEKGVMLGQNLLSGLTAAMPQMLQSGVEIVTNVANGILNNLPGLITAAGSMLNSLFQFILENAPTIASAGVDLIVNLASGIVSAIPQVVVAIASVAAQLIATLVKYGPKYVIEGATVITKLISGIIQLMPRLGTIGLQIGKALVDKIKSVNWIKAGQDIINGLIKGVKDAGNKLIQAIVNLCKDSLGAVKKFFGIKSPSRVMRDQVGKFLPAGIAVGIDENASDVTDAMQRLSRVTTSSISASDMIPDISRSTGASVSGINMMLSKSNEALEERMDALVQLVAMYLPVVAENTENSGFSASDMAKYFNRSLGRAMT